MYDFRDDGVVMIIKDILKKSKFLYKMVTYIKWHERKISYGVENSEIEFYVIRRHDMHAGLFSFMTSNLGAIKTAIDGGYVPVIDMMNSENSLMEKENIGKKNSWEDYFLQPCGYTMHDVYHSQNVTLGDICPPSRYPDFPMISNIGELEFWQKCAKKYIHVRPEHQNAIDLYFEENFHGKRVLGVLCRGTDYTVMKPSGHPIQPEIQEVIQKCKLVIHESKCEYIYIATEDSDILVQFKNEFGDKLFTYQKLHFCVDQETYIDSYANSLQNPYERNREYLISIGVLAKCNCLIAGATNGSYAALLLTEGYDYQYIFQLGKYQ